MIEPEFRCGTNDAMIAVAKKLDILYDNSMQDWSYIIANSNEIEKYFTLYKNILDEDEKFVLMEIMIQAIEDQDKEELFVKYLNEVKHLLQEDFHIHESTIFYWSCFDNENIEDCWKISPFMRVLSKSRNLAT
ncbi:hypothetical protein [Flavobacterium reichenbachii]|uniref:hypothetical protein n=1 Tax=Flavobacterium reichenbachii TaxID=362418 RepID=UPI0006908DB8|nr:hypothetical protein [Flavobacterium reichenbachii]OXB13290.1 hypothetical protein B0A68_16155 [Flavobacterium reichenbachii]